MEYVAAFLVGGMICVIGQLFIDVLKFSPAHVMSIFVIAGAVLGSFGAYDWLIDFAGAGATVPISGFGNALIEGVSKSLEKNGWDGLRTGMFGLTGLSLSAAILFSFLTALIFKPKG